MRNHIAAALVLGSAVLFSAGAHAQAVKTQDGILVNSAGMTLYTFDKDAAGVSNCYGDCAVKWPPVTAAAGAKAADDFSLVTRKDGAQQWAFKGMPLYLWQGDKKPGDVHGDGMGGVWHLAKE